MGSGVSLDADAASRAGGPARGARRDFTLCVATDVLGTKSSVRLRFRGTGGVAPSYARLERAASLHFDAVMRALHCGVGFEVDQMQAYDKAQRRWHDLVPPPSGGGGGPLAGVSEGAQVFVFQPETGYVDENPAIPAAVGEAVVSGSLDDGSDAALEYSQAFKVHFIFHHVDRAERGYVLLGDVQSMLEDAGTDARREEVARWFARMNPRATGRLSPQAWSRFAQEHPVVVDSLFRLVLIAPPQQPRGAERGGGGYSSRSNNNRVGGYPEKETRAAHNNLYSYKSPRVSARQRAQDVGVGVGVGVVGSSSSNARGAGGVSSVGASRRKRAVSGGSKALQEADIAATWHTLTRGGHSPTFTVARLRECYYDMQDGFFEAHTHRFLTLRRDPSEVVTWEGWWDICHTEPQLAADLLQRIRRQQAKQASSSSPSSRQPPPPPAPQTLAAGKASTRLRSTSSQRRVVPPPPPPPPPPPHREASAVLADAGGRSRSRSNRVGGARSRSGSPTSGGGRRLESVHEQRQRQRAALRGVWEGLLDARPDGVLDDHRSHDRRRRRRRAPPQQHPRYFAQDFRYDGEPATHGYAGDSAATDDDDADDDAALLRAAAFDDLLEAGRYPNRSDAALGGRDHPRHTPLFNAVTGGHDAVSFADFLTLCDQDSDVERAARRAAGAAAATASCGAGAPRVEEVRAGWTAACRCKHAVSLPEMLAFLDDGSAYWQDTVVDPRQEASASLRRRQRSWATEAATLLPSLLREGEEVAWEAWWALCHRMSAGGAAWLLENVERKHALVETMVEDVWRALAEEGGGGNRPFLDPHRVAAAIRSGGVAGDGSPSRHRSTTAAAGAASSSLSSATFDPAALPRQLSWGEWWRFAQDNLAVLNRACHQVGGAAASPTAAGHHRGGHAGARSASPPPPPPVRGATGRASTRGRRGVLTREDAARLWASLEPSRHHVRRRTFRRAATAAGAAGWEAAEAADRDGDGLVSKEEFEEFVVAQPEVAERMVQRLGHDDGGFGGGGSGTLPLWQRLCDGKAYFLKRDLHALFERCGLPWTPGTAGLLYDPTNLDSRMELIGTGGHVDRATFDAFARQKPNVTQRLQEALPAAGRATHAAVAGGSHATASELWELLRVPHGAGGAGDAVLLHDVHDALLEAGIPWTPGTAAGLYDSRVLVLAGGGGGSGGGGTDLYYHRSRLTADRQAVESFVEQRPTVASDLLAVLRRRRGRARSPSPVGRGSPPPSSAALPPQRGVSAGGGVASDPYAYSSALPPPPPPAAAYREPLWEALTRGRGSFTRKELFDLCLASDVGYEPATVGDALYDARFFDAAFTEATLGALGGGVTRETFDAFVDRHAATAWRLWEVGCCGGGGGGGGGSGSRGGGIGGGGSSSAGRRPQQLSDEVWRALPRTGVHGGVARRDVRHALRRAGVPWTAEAADGLYAGGGRSGEDDDDAEVARAVWDAFAARRPGAVYRLSDALVSTITFGATPPDSAATTALPTPDPVARRVWDELSNRKAYVLKRDLVVALQRVGLAWDASNVGDLCGLSGAPVGHARTMVCTDGHVSRRDWEQLARQFPDTVRRLAQTPSGGNDAAFAWRFLAGGGGHSREGAAAAAAHAAAAHEFVPYSALLRALRVCGVRTADPRIEAAFLPPHPRSRSDEDPLVAYGEWARFSAAAPDILQTVCDHVAQL